MRGKTGAGFALLLVLGAMAGCGGGGGGGDGVASAGTPSASASASAPAGGGGDEKQKLLQYAKCMRENGVPDFPDPQFQGDGGVSLNLPEGADTARVDAAQATCKRLLPNGGENGRVDPQVTEKLREYAKCVRANGVPNFPDPSPGGGLQIDNDKLGLTPDDPRLQAAQQACSGHLPAPPGGGAGTRTRGTGGAA